MNHDYSPDRPAGALKRFLGFKDSEPPISDEEYRQYVRFREGAAFAPQDLVDSFPPCPRKANQASRTAIRWLLADPRIPAILDQFDAARRQEEERQAVLLREAEAVRRVAEQQKVADELAKIDAFHSDHLNVVRLEVGDFTKEIGRASVREASIRIAQDSQSDHTRNMRAMNLSMAQQGGGNAGLLLGVLASAENSWRDKGKARQIADQLSRITIRRSLVSMKDSERATLRMTDILIALGLIDKKQKMQIVVPVVWNDGECDIEFGRTTLDFKARASMLETLKPLIASSLATTAGARERLNDVVRRALDPARGLPADQREIIERYLYSGNRWMNIGDIADRKTLEVSPSALRIGRFADTDAEYLYDLRESVATIAAPGSGKSQAHVLRNLLYLRAPAVVLDVKGEMLSATRAWRETHVGPAFAFSPHDPGQSICYNPLDDIRTDPEVAWDDARRIADLLVVPASPREASDYFENRARDMITTALLDVAVSEEDDKRTMAGVLDRLYMSSDEDIIAWCKHLKQTGLVQLERQASALQDMPPKQRESVLDTARRQLEIWQSPAITKLSATTTFDLDGLRRDNATLYLAVSLEDIRKYASVLRVLIGQVLARLYRVKPEGPTSVITFFLDELPRLGRMDVIEQSLDMGRGYAVRLWLFCQNYGQLDSIYPNAQGMMSNCALRCYMNPDEDTARWLSKNLGTREGLLDGHRKPLVEPYQLTGPEFASRMVVFARGAPPARLDKQMAYQDPLCVARMLGVEGPASLGEPASPAPHVVEDEPPSALGAEAARDPDWSQFVKAQPARDVDFTPVIAPPDRFRPASPKAMSWKYWLFPAGLALALAGLAGWSSLQDSRLRSLEGVNASLVQQVAKANAQGDETRRLQLALQTSRASENSLRQQTETARAELLKEREQHAATRARLANAERILDSRMTPAAPPSPSPAPAATTALPSAPAPLASVDVTPCDTLAANPNDPRRTTTGVRFPDLRANARAAIEACDQALVTRPRDPRLLYQRARALHAAGDSRVPQLFDELVAARYPAAFDNAAQLLVNQGRLADADNMYRRGVEYGDPDSMVSLADHIRAGRLNARFPGEDSLLYKRAADSGHIGAKADVDMRRANEAAGQMILDQASGVFRRVMGR